MEFDEIDEFEEKFAKQDLISNLELLDDLEKESVAVDELLLRQRLVDDVGYPLYDCQMDYSTLKPTSLKRQGKESKDISSEPPGDTEIKRKMRRKIFKTCLQTIALNEKPP